MGIAAVECEKRIERRCRNIADDPAISRIAVLIGILLHRVAGQQSRTDALADLGIDAGDQGSGEQDIGHQIERGDRLDDFSEALGYRPRVALGLAELADRRDGERINEAVIGQLVEIGLAFEPTKKRSSTTGKRSRGRS